MNESRTIRPPPPPVYDIHLGDLQNDVRTVLQLIHDGKHDEARRHRRQSTFSTFSVDAMIDDVYNIPLIEVYQRQGWRRIAVDYGPALAAFVGRCGDVVATHIITTTTRNGNEVGSDQKTFHYLRGLRESILDHIESHQSNQIALGLDLRLGGWTTFFARCPCGSAQIEKMDAEMIAFFAGP
ncbi:MAG: hypothetical protein ACK4HF_14065 [Paracoccaceae bacterium]